MTSTRARAISAIVVAAAGLSLSSSARAREQSEAPGPAPLSGAEVTLAETLYREGRKLMAEQRYVEACAKFAESHRLDPATGTLLNLATCHEAQGKLASAWIAFSEAARAARREGREDRQRFAEEHLQAIEPRLSRLTVEVTKTLGAEEVKVAVDGVGIGPAAFGVAAPIDPGTHRIEASAPGFEKWTAEVVIGGSADHRVVTVPALEPEAPAPAAPAPSTTIHATPPSSTAAVPFADAGQPPSRPIPAAVYVTAGATLLLAGAAVVTGLTYLDRKDDYAAIRDDDSVSLEDRREKRDDAKLFGWLNVGFTAGALVGAGVTAFLFTTRPEERRAGRAAPRVAAWVLPRQAGVAFTSEF